MSPDEMNETTSAILSSLMNRFLALKIKNSNDENVEEWEDMQKELDIFFKLIKDHIEFVGAHFP